jgi:hypothetical protein
MTSTCPKFWMLIAQQVAGYSDCHAVIILCSEAGVTLQLQALDTCCIGVSVSAAVKMRWWYFPFQINE